MRACAGCGTPVEQPRRGWRKWCSEKCRKGSYGDPCIDCGARTVFGAEQARIPEPRCKPCADLKQTVWTRERVVLAIQEWACLYGGPPAEPDWNPANARALGDEARARRFEEADGRWPWFNVVFRRFGSWNEGLVAAGFDPRPGHGGGGNQYRMRSMRAKAAA